MAVTKELPVLAFESALLWERWLSEHQANSKGIWIKMAKKATGIRSVTYDEALDVALCYGWIDGQRNRGDDGFFVQKFTPRRQRSTWSKRNVDKVAKLMAAGRMRPSGLAKVQAAKEDGRWEAAYDYPNMPVPDDFLDALEMNEPARVFFNTLSRTNLFAIAWQLTTAKRPETRKRRFDALLAMLERGEKLV
jgi:uncharacterized protein YdeI (YjbR/CyaY-like superfamily)